VKNFGKYTIIFSFVIASCLGFAPVVFAYQAPIANAGADLYIISGQNSVLQGSGYDADGGTLTYSWECTGGNLSNSTIAQPIFTAPTVIAFNNQDNYACTLTVKDESGLTNSDTTKISVNYGSVSNIVNIDAKTNPATSVSNNQATLNGYFSGNNNSASRVWFQYGLSTSYGSETTQQTIAGTSGSFTQSISSLYLNATYHYRSVVQDYNGNKFYGQDVTFLTNSNYYNNGNFSISKKAINISAGNLIWSESVTANPSDILSFSIAIQANNNQDLHNVIIKDILPSNLIYNDNLLVNAVRDYSANPITGINIGTIKAGEVIIISYQAKVAIATSFIFGTTNLTADTTVTSNETGLQTDNVTIVVNNSQVSGISTTTPTTISTGLTNKLFTESFFLPMLLIIAGSWFYFSGRVYQFADWMGKYL